MREDPVFRREKEDIHVDAVLSVTQVPSSVFMFILYQGWIYELDNNWVRFFSGELHEASDYLTCPTSKI